MIQGDQYQMPITIKVGDTVITPDNCEGVKIDVGGTIRESPGTLAYDAVDSVWLYQLTQAQTLGFSGLVGITVQVNMGGNPAEIIGSKPQFELVDESTIREAWSEE